MFHVKQFYLHPIVSLLDLEEDYTFDELISESDSVILDYSTANESVYFAC